MTKAIYMAIQLDQDIMVTNMCLKFGEDWTNNFQELDRKQSSGRTYVQTRATQYAATLWGHKNGPPNCTISTPKTAHQTVQYPPHKRLF